MSINIRVEGFDLERQLDRVDVRENENDFDTDDVHVPEARLPEW